VDRIDAMKVFVAVLDEGGLRKAGRKLGKSPAAMSRALAFLEARVGITLLHRTARSFKLSEAGERYAIVCRHVLRSGHSWISPCLVSRRIFLALPTISRGSNAAFNRIEGMHTEERGNGLARLYPVGRLGPVICRGNDQVC
jgi:DNA-binding transcriptional LysR family regulator